MLSLALLLSAAFVDPIADLQLSPKQIAMLKYEVSIAKEYPANVPIPMDIVLRNTGDETLTVLELDRPWFQFEVVTVPSNWTIRPMVGDGSLNGILPVAKLEPGKSLRTRLYLQEFVSQIEPGEVELAVRVNGFDKTLKVKVIEPNPAALKTYIQQTKAQLEKSGVPPDAFYESLLFLPGVEARRELERALKEENLPSWLRTQIERGLSAVKGK